eukprot:TRINITY_DN4839_c0_g3_i1.p1 TRINITY_DN4839_c0_g3~~TRINITY_DN4839_c0_g3_i1.p1  ORF type:complete len:1133 (+),score=307.99 TRINITY_DN4839_c0_g3_i1:153-3551(+)
MFRFNSDSRRTLLLCFVFFLLESSSSSLFTSFVLATGSCPTTSHADENAIEYVETGLELQEQGRLKEAQDCFQEYVARNPEEGDGWLMLGDNYRLQRLCFDDAINAYELADRYAQGSSEAQNGIGLCYLNRSSSSASASSSSSSSSSKRDAWKAAEHFLRAILYDEKHVPASANLAAALLRLGQKSDALKALNRALTLSPSFADTPTAKKLSQLIDSTPDDAEMTTTSTTTTSPSASTSPSSKATSLPPTPSSTLSSSSPKPPSTTLKPSSQSTKLTPSITRSPHIDKQKDSKEEEEKRKPKKKDKKEEEDEKIITIRADENNPYDSSNLGTIATSSSPTPSTHLPPSSSTTPSPSIPVRKIRKRIISEGKQISDITSSNQKSARSTLKSAVIAIKKISSSDNSNNKLINNAAEAVIKSISLDPTFEEAWEELHKLRLMTKDYETSVDELEEAIEWLPNSARLHALLGDTLLAIAKLHKSTTYLSKAAKAYKASLILNPTTTSFINLAEIKTRTGKNTEALELLKEAAALDKNDNAVLLALVNAYQKLGDSTMSIKLLQKLIQREPTKPQHYDRYAGLLQEAGNYDEAIKNYLVAISLAINSPANYYHSLGDLYLKTGNIEEAIRVYGYSYQQNPNNTKSFMSLLWVVASSCDWEEFNKQLPQLKSIVKQEITNDILPPSLSLQHAINYVPAKEHFKLVQQWSKYIERESSSSSRAFEYVARKSREERIRIGYVITSLDSFFSNGRSSVLSVLGAHNKWRFEVFLYSLLNDSTTTTTTNNNMLKLARDLVEHYVILSGQSPRLVANRINEDKVHILVNVEGWNEQIHRIFSLKPAPVQVGLQQTVPGSSGSSWMQYLVTDPVSTPLKQFENVLSESVIQLPLVSSLRGVSRDKSKTLTSPLLTLSPADRTRLRKTVLNITDKTFVYAYFGELTKIDKTLWTNWMKILHQTDSTVLWIAIGESSLQEHQNIHEVAKQHLRFEADKLGVDSERRIIFTSYAKDPHEAMGACHLLLDSTSYSSSDHIATALAGGIPVVALKNGKSIQARVGESMVVGAGLPELAVSNMEEYVKLAVDLGSSKKRYGDLRTRTDAKAKARMPIFNVEAWVKSFEQGLQSAMEDFEKKNPRKHITVL